ncbi:hypothetical protein ACFX13_031441 [Malus domestica]
MLIHFGSTPVPVVSSAEAACEIMKTHNTTFANKPQIIFFKKFCYNFKDVSFAPYETVTMDFPANLQPSLPELDLDPRGKDDPLLVGCLPVLGTRKVNQGCLRPGPRRMEVFVFEKLVSIQSSKDPDEQNGEEEAAEEIGKKAAKWALPGL